MCLTKFGRLNVFVIALFVFMAAGLTAEARLPEKDVKGSKDHPIISRFPGSHIANYEFYKFNEYLLPMGATAKIEGKYKHKSVKEIEGKVTRLTYLVKAGVTAHEVYSSYMEAFKNKGFEILFKCKKRDCGRNWENTTYFLNELNINPNGDLGGGLKYGKEDNQRFITARLKQDGKSIYATLYVTQGWWKFPAYQLDVIEVAEMEKGQVKIDPKAGLSEINKKGHIAVYGINFDTGKATIKKESFGVIKKIADILNIDKKLKLYVVGHTDDTGAFDLNMRLSKDRAEAIVRELVNKYKIKKSRLKADGVGPLVPLATNETTDGRAKNRRVDLVKMLND